MYPGGSTVAVDTSASRNSDILTAFMSEVLNDFPVDNRTVLNPTLDHLKQNARIKSWGRQAYCPIYTGTNTTGGYYSGYDEFDATPQSAARSVNYAMVNWGQTVVVNDEELTETKGDRHKIYDLVKFKKQVAEDTCFDDLNEDCYAAAPAADELNSLAVMIDSTGSCGDLSATTDAQWASVENAGGVFTAQGYADMITMYNDLKANKSHPSAVMTTQAIHELYELEHNVDVRYGDPKMAGKRGVKELFFKDIPILWDDDCTAGVMYFLNNKHLFLAIESSQNFQFDPFAKPVKQKAQISLFHVRLQIMCDKRNAQGKITGIS